MADVDLVLLTSSFPYGSVAETFLETELPIIAPYFRSIYVLPSERDDGIRRPVPENVEIVEMPWLAGYGAAERRRALLSADAARVLWWSARTWRDLLGYAASPKVYADILARNLLKARDLTKFVSARALGAAAFYDYWFENSTLALAIVRARGTIATAVSRAHGFDIYDHAWDGHPVPFRQAKARNLDAVFAVSDYGAAYLRRRVPALATKLVVRRLGTIDPETLSPAGREGVPPLVVSCARLISSKRIHLIPEVLAELNSPVRWIHIGDGPERERVREAAQGLLTPGTWDLLGGLPNDEVLRFYASNSVQAMLSVSESEGVPVSMMEAQSFGIPIVACDVGGVSEIVSRRSGVLLRADASPAEIATALRSALTAHQLTRETVRTDFRSRYDADANYRGFIDDIIALRASAASRT